MKPAARVGVVLLLLFCWLVYYSQNPTIDWDEGFHLVAASLIATGKRPYIDFCFPQPALHAWWNALWLNLTGGTWRGPHVMAALAACGATGMTADFVYRRMEGSAWRTMGASVAAIFVGLNEIVVEFGTKAQAYGACMLLTVASFRALSTPKGIAGSWRVLAAGCLAGAAAACSLLTAPACAVLLLWILWRRAWLQAAVFVCGLAISTLRLAASMMQAPFQTWFNLVDYHVHYRFVHWTGATRHDFEVLASWADSGPALLLGLFALAGLWFVKRSDWAATQRAEFYLAAWMAAGLSIEAMVAHPTFPQYFIFVVPFLAMLAGPGFGHVIDRIALRPGVAVPGLTALLLISLAGGLSEWADDNNTWTAMEALARKVHDVTPANAQVLADPPVYFAMRSVPPSGMEFPASHRLEVPPEMAAMLHIVPQSVLEKRVKNGDFATVETCKGDEDEIQALDLPEYYAQSQTISECKVYWDFKHH